MSKAQIAIEFIFIIMILLMVFYLAVSLKNNHLFQTNQMEVSIKAKQICESTATVIDKVAIGGQGTSATINIPINLGSVDYKVHFSPEKTISIILPQSTIFCTFKSKVESGTLNSFDLEKGEHILYNKGEVVEIK